MFDTGCLLDQLRRKTDQWLMITIRFIYNSGYRLLPLHGASHM
jgi:hypothetical protein